VLSGRFRSPSHDVSLSRRAYTILEVVMVLVVISTLAAVSLTALGGAKGKAESVAARPTLATVQAELRRVLDNEGNVPADVAAALQIPGLTVTASPSTSTSTVSVSAAGSRAAVYAVVVDEACVVLVDRLDDGESWATAPLATHTCAAVDFLDAVELITGTATDPTEIS
jgi:type II secretory pathway pseudopilin PulG